MTRGDLQPKADEESVLNGEVGHVCKRLGPCGTGSYRRRRFVVVADPRFFGAAALSEKDSGAGEAGRWSAGLLHE